MSNEVTLINGATVVLLYRNSVHTGTSTIITYEAHSTLYLGPVEIREWVGNVIPFGCNYYIGQTKMSPSESGTGFDFEASVVVHEPIVQIKTSGTKLVLAGKKFKLARQWEDFDETNYVVFIEDCTESVICLFADGKRRLVPRDAINWNSVYGDL